jgi:DNA-binding transcriptional MerR regulator
MSSYTLGYASGLLGISKETLRKWIKKGFIRGDKGYSCRRVCKQIRTQKWLYLISEEEIKRVVEKLGKISPFKLKQKEIAEVTLKFLSLIREHKKEIERLEKDLDKQITEILLR